MDMRIFSLDAGRKYFSLDELKNIARTIARAGYTHFHLLLGNDGLRFILDDMTITSGGKEYKSETVKKAIVDGNIAYYQEYENEKKKKSRGHI